MPGEVQDDFMRTAAACGTHDEIVPAIRQRFAGAADTIEVNLSEGTDPAPAAEIVSAMQGTSCAFEGSGRGW